MKPDIGNGHHRRLREIWRSAGWPCRDAIEIELLAAGLLARVRACDGRETLRVTDAGVQLLAQTLLKNRAAFDAHEALVERVATAMTRAGRLVWTRLSLRAKVDAAWVVVMPDVFSIRHTTVEAYIEPVVHEIKVSRADLLSDLRSCTKGAAYLQLAGECWYVLREGIAQASELPEEFGVIVARDGALEVVRPAPKRPMQLPLGSWMALARATPRAVDDDAQRWLGDPDAGGAQ